MVIQIERDILILYIDELKPIKSPIYYMVSSVRPTLFRMSKLYNLTYISLLYFIVIYFCHIYIGSKSTPIDNSILNFQSTCHEALETCNKHSHCQEMVASIIRNCNHRQCKKANCMESLQNFYRNESMHSYAIEIAFCLCKWVPLATIIIYTWIMYLSMPV